MAAVATFVGGPLDGGALQELPPGSLLKVNDTELHIPQPDAVAIYQHRDGDATEATDIPAWTFLRAEPVYRRR